MQWQELKQPPETQERKSQAEEGTASRAGHVTTSARSAFHPPCHSDQPWDEQVCRVQGPRLSLELQRMGHSNSKLEETARK